MRTMKLIATMMTLSMLAAAFAGCLGGDDDEDEKTTVKIGFLNPITGPLEPNAPVFTWSANEAINDLNAMYADYNFELIEQDSGCDGAVAGPLLRPWLTPVSTLLWARLAPVPRWLPTVCYPLLGSR